MTTFKEASQTRVALKMELSQYSWYNGCGVYASPESYFIGILVSKINPKVKKTIPSKKNGVNIKILLDG